MCFCSKNSYFPADYDRTIFFLRFEKYLVKEVSPLILAERADLVKIS